MSLGFFNLFAAPAPSSNTPITRKPTAEEEELEWFIALGVNQYRAYLEKTSLIIREDITTIARNHSQYLSDNNIWSGVACHDGWREYRSDALINLNLRAPAENIATLDGPIFVIGSQEGRENIATAALNGWLESQRGHRETMENDYVYTGVGVIVRETGDRHLIYVTQLFGK